MLARRGCGAGVTGRHHAWAPLAQGANFYGISTVRRNEHLQTLQTCMEFRGNQFVRGTDKKCMVLEMHGTSGHWYMYIYVCFEGTRHLRRTCLVGTTARDAP